MKAKYCKSKNTYTIEQCTQCKCYWYWAQGIGSLTGNTATAETGFGSELVQNGDFEELGSELVINGSFDTDSSWTYGDPCWSISGGTLNADGTATNKNVYQTPPLVIGKTYQITYTISNWVQGGVQAYCGLGSGGSTNSANGTYTETLTCASTSTFYFYIRSAGVLSVDNVSVKQVDPNDEWSKLNATISGGNGNLDGDGQTSLLWQDILVQNKEYEAIFTVSNYNGIGQSWLMNSNADRYYDITSNGTFTVRFTHTESNGLLYFRAINGAIYSIDNVSVKEVL